MESEIPPLIKYLLEATRIEYGSIVQGIVLEKLGRIPVVILMTGENPYKEGIDHSNVVISIGARHLHERYEALRQMTRDILPFVAKYREDRLKNPLTSLGELLR